MEAQEAAPPPKPAKPDLVFYTILFCLLCVLAGALVKNHVAPGQYKTILMATSLVLFLTQLNIVIGMTYDAVRRYSRFGISHKHKVMNHALSLALILLPIASFVDGLILCAALALMSFSKYRSPDNDRQQALPFYKRDGFYEAVNAVLWGCVLLLPAAIHAVLS